MGVASDEDTDKCVNYIIENKDPDFDSFYSESYFKFKFVILDLKCIKKLVDAFKENDYIESFYFENPIEEEALDYLIVNYLSTKEKVETLQITNCKFTKSTFAHLINFIKNNLNLVNLYLSEDYLETPDVKLIAEAIQTNTSIKSLDLSENFIDINGFEILSKALENTSIEALYLSGNEINVFGYYNYQDIIDDSPVENFFKSIGRNKNLVELGLSRCAFIRPIYYHYLAEALRINNIKKLDISNNFDQYKHGQEQEDLTEKSLEYIFNLLEDHHNLRILDIEYMVLSVKICQSLGRALEKNTHIEKLTLKHCCINPEKFKYISRALRKNTSLSILKIDFNNIDHTGYKYLAEDIISNNTLLYFDFKTTIMRGVLCWDAHEYNTKAHFQNLEIIKEKLRINNRRVPANEEFAILSEGLKNQDCHLPPEIRNMIYQYLLSE